MSLAENNKELPFDLLQKQLRIEADEIESFVIDGKLLSLFWQSEVAVNYSCLFFLSIHNLSINVLFRNVLCKFKFIDENNIEYIQFSSYLFLVLY
jgi:hypothetical protein